MASSGADCRATTSAARARRSGRPRIEWLEDRRLMAVTFHEFPLTQLGVGTTRALGDLTAGPDGALYFGLDADNPSFPGQTSAIGRITTDGSISQLPLPPLVAPLAITAGPDGALWFVGSGQGAIDRITTDGKSTGFVTPQPLYEQPVAIAAGPDGALWFPTDDLSRTGLDEPPSRDGFGRITTDGKFSEFPLPPGDASYDLTGTAITAGPDGALWFIEQGRNSIGRIATDGKITKFAVPTTDAYPVAIAAGPDGALWFTEENAGKIGRITTSGTITEFPLPAGALPDSIAPGPDGAVWFTDSTHGTLGRISTTGAVTITPIPNASTRDSPENLVLGPDHNLWFTLRDGAIAQAVISTTPTTTTVGADPSFVPPGQPIFLSALVKPQGTGGGTPTGTVAFTVDGTPEPPVPLVFSDFFDGASLALPSLPEGTHRITALYSGDASFAPSMSAAPAQVIVSLAARSITATTVTADPNPGAAGQRIILTAAITSTPAPPPTSTPALAARAAVATTGVVTFFVDGAQVASTPLQLINTVSGLAQAVLPSLPAGTHQIVATYSGDPTLTPSTSAPFVETVTAAPVTDGPRVTSLRRFGFHAQPTLLVIAFDGPLAPASARDTANYHVVGPVSPRGKGSRVDPVIAALYDAATNTVTLALRQRLDVHLRYGLTINGVAPDGVSSPAGVLLDGAGTGRPGSNFETIFGREILAGPARAIHRAAQARRTAAPEASAARHVVPYRPSLAAALARGHAKT